MNKTMHRWLVALSAPLVIIGALAVTLIADNEFSVEDMRLLGFSAVIAFINWALNWLRSQAPE